MRVANVLKNIHSQHLQQQKFTGFSFSFFKDKILQGLLKANFNRIQFEMFYEKLFLNQLTKLSTGIIKTPAGDKIDSPLQGGIDSPLLGGIDSPLQGGIDSPLQGGIDSPLQGGIDSPLQGGIESPLQGGIDSPLQGGIDSPLQGEINSPPQGGIDSPIQGGIGSPLQSGIGSPLQSGIGSPLQSGIDSPLQGGIDSPLQGGIESPLQSEMKSMPNGSDEVLIGWGGIENIPVEEMKKLLVKESSNIPNPTIEKLNNMNIPLQFKKKFIIPTGYCHVLEDFTTKGFELNERIAIYLADGDFDIFVTDSNQKTVYSIQWQTFSTDLLMKKLPINTLIMYEVNIRKNIFDPNDPKTQCQDYSAKGSKYSSYEKCMEEEQYIDHLPLLGCINPFLTSNESRACTNNVGGPSVPSYIDYLNQNILLSILYKQSNTIPECPLPCTRLEISLRTIQNVDNITDTSQVVLFFKNSISVRETYRSFDFIPLLVEIGGSLGFYLGFSCLSILELLAFCKAIGTQAKKVFM